MRHSLYIKNLNLSFKDCCFIKNDLNNFKDFIKKNPLVLFISLIATILSYGIKLFYYSISIDSETLLQNYYATLNWRLALGRFSSVALKKIFMIASFNPFVAIFLTIFFIIISNLTWSYLIAYFCDINEKNIYSITIFPIIFLTYPCFAEQFNFINQSFEVSVGICLCSIAIFFISKWALLKYSNLYMLLGITLMIFSFGIYQAIVPLYCSGVLACCILFVKTREKFDIETRWLNICIKYLSTFIFSLIVYFILYKIFATYFYDKTISYAGFVTGDSYLNTRFCWGKENIISCLQNIKEYIKSEIIYKNVFSSRLYILAILIFEFNFIHSIVLKNGDKVFYFLLSLIFISSPFLETVILGSGITQREQFVFPFILAFMSFYISTFIINNLKIKAMYFFIIAIIGFHQCQTTAQLLYSDYARYEQDVTLADNIYNKVEQLGLNPKNNTIVFIGAHSASLSNSYITGEMIGKSFFEWDSTSPQECNMRISAFMNSLGYDYLKPSLEQIQQGRIASRNMDNWPMNNSIEVLDNIIVVKLSNSQYE